MNSVPPSVVERLIEGCPRCIECGKYTGLEIHHRIFRSQGDLFLADFLESRKDTYKLSYNRDLVSRGLHDIQNLVVLCNDCHTKLHNNGSNTALASKYRESFTCPKTLYNIPFYQRHSLY